MKAKILFLTFSLTFATLQFFGQGINIPAVANPGLVSSMGNLTMDEGITLQLTQADFKSSSELKEALKLTLTCDANAYSDEAIVIFNNSDTSQGALKLMSMHDNAPELWSVKNGQKYTVSFLGSLDSAVIVPIMVKAGAPGIYTLTASLIESFGPATKINLIDEVSDSSINLGTTLSYSFQVSGDTTFTDRFYLHFVNTPSDIYKEITSFSDNEVARNFKMFAVDGYVRITSLQNQSGKIAVFDMSGRRIASGRVEAGETTQLYMHGNIGVFIVCVSSNLGFCNGKILVR
jgi:hypothetical protein